MATEVTREKREASWQRYFDRRRARLARERRGHRIEDSNRRRIGAAIRRASEALTEPSDPWSDEDWFGKDLL